MSDTWSDIQAHKKQLDSLRERLQRRRKEPSTPLAAEVGASADVSLSRSDSPVASAPCGTREETEKPPDPELEKRMLAYLSDLSLSLPKDSLAITKELNGSETAIAHGCIQSLLLKFSAQELIEVRQSALSSSCTTVVVAVDHTKLWAMIGSGAGAPRTGVKRKIEEQSQHTRSPGFSPSSQGAASPPRPTAVPSVLPASSRQMSGPPCVSGSGADKKGRSGKSQSSHLDMEIESLLNQQSTKEQQSKKVSREILELLNASTAKEQSIVEKFRSRGRAQVQEFCDHGTKEECVRSADTPQPCTKLHFRRIINNHTDENLGDCSFLNTCFHMDTCKYVHYEIDSPPEAEGSPAGVQPGTAELGLCGGDSDSNVGKLFPAQWICCDIRYLDVSVLGKFAVVMADPPWDIHMELPYGTLTDDEMRKLNIPVLQDNGFLFLWVTGRAMELGRECLSLWGYERVDEIIWVKTNQLQRIIRTGRTGHWLNHGKEHCLVGVKGNPQGFNRGLDCDVIVAEVRSTSHKPDEIYGMIERLSPGTRKIELFGRPHNVQPNWVTLGNQLDGIHLLDPEVVARFKERYPDGVISKPKNM
ncbi:N6-adenosine-methyltransferase subunit METTL3 [Corythoichthys intestinalis]|uniref:N6-adenosine-methyltransferase subunit METTL3 n=1 Tax=Corythoichthys intestinalis TaxID=161448 RepID=UPI0025A594DC|nr:N6-adenosine-methyltransferase subunit METTL3 [Corythoichthys intestinalis]XP_061811004.1 N6-adenosine-methyltransferase subunit METTL3-like [Nerophis lumbriciformis]